MALSMDEQRMLAEIERRLAAEDPGLAARMSSFRRPGPTNVFRSARARVIGSLLAVVVVAMISLMVYAMVPFRSNSTRTLGGHPVASRGLPVITASSGGSAKAGASKVAGGTAAGTAKANGSNAAKTAPGTTTRRSQASGTASGAPRTTNSASAAAARPASTVHGP